MSPSKNQGNKPDTKLDLIWVWFYKDIAPTALKMASHLADSHESHQSGE
jgi:hypothetical protein